MPTSPHDIAAEHEAALRSLSAAQRRAFERLTMAENRSSREGYSVDVCLQGIFIAEAAARSMTLANDR